MASPRSIIKRLFELRGVFHAGGEKVDLLRKLEGAQLRRAPELRRLHHALCYFRAFPDNAVVLERVTVALGTFHERVGRLSAITREKLADSGIAGTRIFHRCSLPAARWLVNAHPGAVEIDWSAFQETATLDEILALMLAPAEKPAFEEGDYSTREWLDIARGASTDTDFEWIVHAIAAEPRLRSTGADLFNEADVPFRWRLAESAASITRNRLAARPAVFRRAMRKLPARPSRLIARPLPGIQLLSRRAGLAAWSAAMSALLVRHREVFSMNAANPAEVWEAPLGLGAQLLVFGVRDEERPVVESNYGYMLLSNGAPIGYGGVSPIFDQGNTGINVFEEYRRSEAAYLFAQTLRAFRTLFGCRHFIANPYQFGADNAEAIGSGAFWFYYRLGFRPSEPEISRLAEREARRLTSRKGYRSDRKTLRALARSDLVLSPPGAGRSTMFPERWLIVLGEGAARLIAAQQARTRRAAMAQVIGHVADQLEARSRSRWPRRERAGFDRLAPVVGLIRDLAGWPKADKRRLVTLMRAKGAADSRSYVRLLSANTRLRTALAAYCRRRERGD